jgi:hypothetical protein
MTRALRAVGVLIAAAGVLDPGVAVKREEPVRVELPTPASTAARELGDRLVRDLGQGVVVNSGEDPDAVVIAADARDSVALSTGAPISVLLSVPKDAPNVRLIHAISPAAVLVGQRAVVAAEFDANGMTGESSVIELLQSGVTLASIEHRWTQAHERFSARLDVVPPAAGLRSVTVNARPVRREASDEDNAAEVALLASARTLRVAVYEPRPSWTAGFVRRALELDPLFSASSLTRPSRGRAVTAGPPLPTLSPENLAGYDAVVIGAPEELTTAEVAALSAFCEVRGGAVILLPDRRPSGPYAALASSSGFDEVLLDKPIALGGELLLGMRASEFALPRRLEPGSTAVGTLTDQSRRAAIVSVPLGRGRVLFSGALDAWRFRATGEHGDAFAHFWTGIVANLAAASPPRVSISVEPAVAAPGDRLHLRATVDSHAFPPRPGGEGPAVGASLVSRDGAELFVRLWTASAVGVFEGEMVAPAAGMYDARVTVAGAAADTPVMVANGVRHPPAYQDEALRLVAATTGGVVVDAADPGPLVAHLRGISRRQSTRTLHPMRSTWWILPFAAALCGEWAWRRRRGAR